MGEVVYQYGGPPLPFGTIDAGVPGVFPLYEGVDPADLGAHEGKALLLVATPFDPATVVSTPGPLPFGTVEGRGAWSFDSLGAATTIYPAATHGASTAPGDTPASTYVPAKFTGEITSQVSLFGGADPLEQGASSVGELSLVDPDGGLDPLLDLGWDGAALEIRRGVPGAAFSTYQTVAKLTAAGMVGDLRTKALRLRTLGWLLESAELHGNRYAGTGGLEGDATLAGRGKPYALGWSFNDTPVIINAVLLIGQLSYTSIASVDAVRDGAAALTFSADYSTYAALAAATVAPGYYATCLAYGLIRLGATPVLGITVDVQGDNDTVGGVTPPTTRAGMVRRIATAIGTVRFSDSEQIDFRSFQDFDNRQPAPVGFYWDGGQPVTKDAAIRRVLRGCLGWYFVRPNGQIRIGQLEDPAVYGAALTLDYPAAGSGPCRLGEPTITDVLEPRRATLIGYAYNNTIQTQDKLAGSVSQADALIYGQQARYAGEGSQWLANNFPNSPTVVIDDSGYRYQPDALAEAQRQTALFSVHRRRYAVPVVMDPLADAVGQRTQIRNLGRLGWGASKQLLACGFEAAGSDVKLHLWA